MEESAKAVVFVNSLAGRGGAAGRIADIRAEFARRNFAVTLVECGSQDEFRKAVQTAVTSGCPMLVAMGGDGTLQLLVREVIGADVSIGVIPAGGGNDVARALGVNNWKEAVRVIADGNTRSIDVVSVRFANGEAANYLGGGGVGLDAEAARLANSKFKRWPGRLRYVAAAVYALRGYGGIDIDLDVPGIAQPITGRVLLAAALNTRSYGGGVKLAPEAQVDDGQLDLIVVEMLSGLEIARLVPSLLLRGELRTSRMKRYRAARVTFRAKTSAWLHGDGEILGRVPAEIAVLPRAIRMLAPKQPSATQERK